MTAPDAAGTEAAALQDAAAAQARLADLRRDGAWRLDPSRFGYLEALARRLPAQPEAVQAALLARLLAGVDDYAQRFAQARRQSGEEAARVAAKQPALARELRRLQATGDVHGVRRLAARAAQPAGCEPLAQLNAWLREASPSLREAQATGEPARRDELASVRRFRRTWTSQRSLERVEQAVARKPANAGPLNSHALVLQSLAVMRALSPDYLRRFLAQVESLQWLERAKQQYPAQAAKGARGAKAKRRK